jgi:hypothetical protein
MRKLHPDTNTSPTNAKRHSDGDGDTWWWRNLQ